ncbi:hypothetical protein GCM10027429_11450 [Marivirga atlantica]|uniref:Heparin lyase I family protein n=1 Tax=Marivirga atlantica TaxID=1548457 RepID=A0A937AJK5_9BACT|nr:heparin lyase I family protein [Marivirga atlantica]MBL0764758.1 heparin lyase I family protein [Marivirga atlantica]
MKKIILILAIHLFINQLNAQLYFYDDIEEYDNYNDLIENPYYQPSQSGSWVDLNQNNQQEAFEVFKNTSIFNGPDGNTAIKVEFNRISDSLFFNYNKNTTESPINFQTFMNRNEFTVTNECDLKYDPNKEHWFHYRIKLDPDYELEPIYSFNESDLSKNSHDIIGQFHTKSKPSKPPLNIQIIGHDWYVVTHGETSNTQRYRIASVIKDEWVSWKIRVKFSIDNNGLIEIWKDNELVFYQMNERNQPVLFNLYWKLGIYKPNWWNSQAPTSTEKKVFYIDDIWASDHDLNPINIEGSHLSLKEEDCNKQIDGTDMKISAFPVDGNYTYKFRIRNTANETIHFVESSSPTIDLSSKEWIVPNTTYQVLVRAVNHPIFGSYGNTLCTISTPSNLSLKLIDEDCNKQIDGTDMKISAFPVDGNYTYKFRIRNTADETIHFVESSSPTIDLSSKEWIVPNTTYQVLVRAVNHPIFGGYGNTLCTISTPSNLSLKLIDEDCNKQIDGTDMKISAFPVDGNYTYKFRIRNTADETIHFVESSSPTIDLSSKEWIVPNTTYQVLVRAVNHPIFGGYGNTLCTISTPSNLSLKLIDEDCGNKINDWIISTNSLNNDFTYEFKFERIKNNGTTDSIISTHIEYSLKPSIDLSMFNWIKNDWLYRVSVRVTNNYNFNNFDSYCYIRTSCLASTSENRSTGTSASESSKAKLSNFTETRTIDVFPNPFFNRFYISEIESYDQLEIYSIDGQKIEFNTEGNSIFIRENIPAGIYLINATRQGKVRFAKIIKK